MSAIAIRRFLHSSCSFQKLILERGSTFALISPKRKTSNNIIRSTLPDVVIPNVNINEYLIDKFLQWPDKIAVECAITGKKYTYDEVVTKSKNLSKSLRKKLKLKREDVIGVLLPNVPEFPICILGAADAGLTITTINPTYTADEIKRQLIDSNAKALITISSLWSTAYNATKLLPQKTPILAIKTEETDFLPTGAIDFREFTDTRLDLDDLPPTDLDSLLFLPYSSGTTGLPKGVELTHKNILATLSQMSSASFDIVKGATENEQEVLPAILPFFHIYGLSCILLACMSRNAKLISFPKFTPDLFISTLKSHKPTTLFVVPPIVIFMSNHEGVKKESLQNLRAILSGAAPLGSQDEEKLLKKIGKEIPILQGYGLTEASPMVLICTAENKKKYKLNASVGEVVPNTLVKLVPIDNVHGEALGPNQPGELLVKGPQIMRGYYNKPEETNKTFVDEWMRTGDVMYYDENKMFYVTDRIKELIKVKGFQVAPAELEAIIRSHPSVEDAAVIGVPHALDGEAPRAFVVPKNNNKLALDELKKYVAERVTSYKQLTGGVTFVEAIPKNASGKILRRDLKEKYLASAM